MAPYRSALLYLHAQPEPSSHSAFIEVGLTQIAQPKESSTRSSLRVGRFSWAWVRTQEVRISLKVLCKKKKIIEDILVFFSLFCFCFFFTLLRSQCHSYEFHEQPRVIKKKQGSILFLVMLNSPSWQSKLTIIQGRHHPGQAPHRVGTINLSHVPAFQESYVTCSSSGSIIFVTSWSVTTFLLWLWVKLWLLYLFFQTLCMPA